MGAWAMGPFDNDNAADFASYVHACTDSAARHDLLSITFGAFMDRPDGDPELRLDDCYELPSMIEEVIASAAFVADAASGRRDFTETSYAMEPADRDDWKDGPWVHADLGEVPVTLIQSALKAVTRVSRMMRHARIGPEWIDSPEKIADVLGQEVSRR